MSLVVEINNESIVSIQELNLVLEEIRALHNVDISIKFKQPIERVELVFIAGLILVAKKNKLKFEIVYPGEIPSKFRFEIRHYFRQFEILYQENWRVYVSSFPGISVLEGDFVASESFAPIIYVDKATIQDFFVNTISENQLSGIGQLAQLYRDDKLYHRKNSNNDEREYFKKTQSIIGRLNLSPPIYTFVFCILFNKIDPFVKTSRKGISDPVRRIEELWLFTCEYIRGIYELAKNITDHGSDHCGMITIRAYDTQAQGETKEKILETHVFDYGDIGIIPSLISFTKGQNDERFIRDLTILNNNYRLNDFLYPIPERLLNQQLFREVAHYGLLRFSRLIDRNEGDMVCSSNSQNGERDIYSSSSSIKTINQGTSYYFALPFQHHLFKVSNQVASPTDPRATTETIKGLSRVLNLKIISDLKELVDPGNEIILDYKVGTDITSRDDISDLFSLIKNFVTGSFAEYLALDLQKVVTPSSNPLRLIALLNNSIPQSIIVYNLEFKHYEGLIEECRQLYEMIRGLRNDVSFWSEEKGVLFFTRITDPNYHFADILYGKNSDEFESWNYLISHTCLNSLSIVKQNSSNSFNYIPAALTPYFHQSSLLPFDTLLKTAEGTTLFESNLMTLLNLELKTNPVIHHEE